VAEGDGAAMGADSQGAGCHTHGYAAVPSAGAWAEDQPRCAFTGTPVQCSAASVADAEGLSHRAGPSLLSGEG